MNRIIVVVEGDSEEKFVNQLLKPFFFQKGIKIEAQKWFTNKKLGSSGGGQSFDLIENHLKKLISQFKNNKSVVITTMIDLYAFPKQGKTIYSTEIENLKSKEKIKLLESRFLNRFENYYLFVPYIQLHEFETLLFSNIEKCITYYFEDEKQIQQLKKEVIDLKPEEINETPSGSPSNRIIKYLPKYKKEKTTASIVILNEIGLDVIIEKCPNFKNWIFKLENIFQ